MAAGPKIVSRVQRSWPCWLALHLRDWLRLVILASFLTAVVEVILWPEVIHLLPYSEMGLRFDGRQHPSPCVIDHRVSSESKSPAFYAVSSRVVLSGMFSVAILCGLIWCLSRSKFAVLYLRKFRHSAAHKTVTMVLESGLGRRYRVVTLDDSSFKPIEVPRTERFLSRFGWLLGLGVSVAVVVVALPVLSRFRS
jgi:hypothetical protein